MIFDIGLRPANDKPPLSQTQMHVWANVSCRHRMRVIQTGSIVLMVFYSLAFTYSEGKKRVAASVK